MSKALLRRTLIKKKKFVLVILLAAEKLHQTTLTEVQFPGTVVVVDVW
jgi:hypothetical protein